MLKAQKKGYLILPRKEEEDLEGVDEGEECIWRKISPVWEFCQLLSFSIPIMHPLPGEISIMRQT